MGKCAEVSGQHSEVSCPDSTFSFLRELYFGALEPGRVHGEAEEPDLGGADVGDDGDGETAD